MVWYSHLFKYFPQFDVICTVTGFGEVKEEELALGLRLNHYIKVNNSIEGSAV